MQKTLVVWLGHVGYVAILFGGPESFAVGWLESVYFFEHDDPRHPIGVWRARRPQQHTMQL